MMPPQDATYTFDQVAVITYRVTTTAGEDNARQAAAGLLSADLDDVPLPGAEVSGDLADDVRYRLASVSPYGRAWLVHAENADGSDAQVTEDGLFAVPVSGEWREDAKRVLAAWEKASTGDSGGAEYEAGLGMAGLLRQVVNLE